MTWRTPYLTQGHSDVVARQIRATYPGQAHFANTGPFGVTCGECGFLGYHRQICNQAGDTIRGVHRGGCEKFRQLTGKDGPVVPAHAAACRYFEHKEEDPKRETT